MVGGVNDVIVRNDGEIIDAIGPPKSNLAAGVGISGGGSPKVTGDVSLDGGDGASGGRKNYRQKIAYVVRNSAHNSTGIRGGPDLRGNGGLLLRGNDQTTLIREPNEVMD